MRFDPLDLPAAVTEFLTERHLASLTTLRVDGTPHVVPVGFTFDPAAVLARIITGGESVKVRNVDRDAGAGRAAVCQIDGRRWLTLEGLITVSRDPAEVADAVDRYSRRYRVPRVNPARVALQLRVDRITGNI